MKKITIFLITALLFTSFAFSSFASGGLPSVVDEAELLTSPQESNIEKKINEIVNKYAFDIVVVTADSLGGKSPMKYADDYYDYNGYGIGGNGDGCLLLISIEENDLWISTKGYGEYVFTDFGIEYVLDKMVDEAGLSYGHYYESVMLFLDCTAEYLEEAKNGKPFDKDNIPTDWNYVLKVSAVISLAAALIISTLYISSLKSQLKTVAPKKDADNYIDNSSLKLSVSKDTFMYSNVSKTPRVQNNSSGSHRSSGGRGGHYSSSGSHHGGGGRKF